MLTSMLDPLESRELDTDIKVLLFCFSELLSIRKPEPLPSSQKWLVFWVFSLGATTCHHVMCCAGLQRQPKKNPSGTLPRSSPWGPHWEFYLKVMPHFIKTSQRLLTCSVQKNVAWPGLECSGPEEVHTCPLARPLRCSPCPTPRRARPCCSWCHSKKRWCAPQEDENSRFQLWLPDLIPQVKLGLSSVTPPMHSTVFPVLIPVYTPFLLEKLVP